MKQANKNKDPLIISRQDAVLILTLNAPRNRNSLQTPGMLEGLSAGLEQLEQDRALRACVLVGSGDAFCSGGDLKLLSCASEENIRLAMTRNAWLYRRIALSEKLIVAAVDGPAYGAGLGLATACDWIVAGDNAVFCSAFTRVGAMPDAALFWSLPARVGIPQARRMMLGATEIRAEQALAIGLADEWARETGALAMAMRAAERFAEGPAKAYGRIKAGLRQFPMSLEQSLSFQLDNAPGLFNSEDFREGAAAFFEKRKPDFNPRQHGVTAKLKAGQ